MKQEEIKRIIEAVNVLKQSKNVSVENNRIIIEFEPEKWEPKKGEWGWSEFHRKALRFSDNVQPLLMVDPLCYKTNFNKHFDRQATREEIEATLKRVYEAKGYKEGMGLTSFGAKFKITGIPHLSNGLSNGNLFDKSGYGRIYNNSTDTWAEIIKVTLTPEQIDAVCEWITRQCCTKWFISNFRKQFSE